MSDTNNSEATEKAVVWESTDAGEALVGMTPEGQLGPLTERPPESSGEPSTEAEL